MQFRLCHSLGVVRPEFSGHGPAGRYASAIGSQRIPGRLSARTEARAEARSNTAETRSNSAEARCHAGSGSAIGKSKLEQETGTVNDRLLGVMPNYGTVETAKKLDSITPGQK